MDHDQGVDVKKGFKSFSACQYFVWCSLGYCLLDSLKLFFVGVIVSFFGEKYGVRTRAAADRELVEQKSEIEKKQRKLDPYDQLDSLADEEVGSFTELTELTPEEQEKYLAAG